MTCVSACQDQINSLTLWSRENPKNQEEFFSSKLQIICEVYNKIKSTCSSDKRQSLLEAYPELCDEMDRLQSLSQEPICGQSQGWNRVELNDYNKTLAQSLEKRMFGYAQENFLEIVVVIKDLTITRVLKDEKTSLISFIANTGGLLGLCVGLSTVSIFEMIYHLIQFIFPALKKSFSS